MDICEKLTHQTNDNAIHNLIIALHKGLALDQPAWRRARLSEPGRDLTYGLTASLAIEKALTFACNVNERYNIRAYTRKKNILHDL